MSVGQLVGPTNCPDQGQSTNDERFGFRSMRATIKMNGVEVTAMVDSGASLSMVSEEWIEKNGLTTTEWSRGGACTVTGEPLQIRRGATLSVEVGGRLVEVEMAVMRMRNQDVLLGNDALVRLGARIDYEVMQLQVPGATGVVNIPVSVREDSCEEVAHVEDVSVEPDWDVVSWNEQLAPEADVRKCVLEAVGEAECTEEERRQLSSLLLANFDVFAVNPKSPGTTASVEHTIEVEEGTRPIYQRAYRVSQKELEQQRQEIEMMLEHGVIEPSSSAWASPVVMVTKPDKSIRF